MVVAMTPDRVIGMDGDMPWHIPEDLKHFRRVTMGHAIIMGRVTHESIGRALPGRQNIVITRQQDAAFEGCDVVEFPRRRHRRCTRGLETRSPRIVGGGAIYEMALPLATKLFLTEVAMDVAGDTFFPAYDPDEWTEVDRREGEGVVYRTLERA